MKRPRLVHFLSVVTDRAVALRASVAMGENRFFRRRPASRAPIRALGLLGSRRFVMRAVGLDGEGRPVLEDVFESDPLGSFRLRIPLGGDAAGPGPGDIKSFQIFETGAAPGLEFHLGTFKPVLLRSPGRVVICDFDRTLLETEYSTPGAIYRSLTRPMGAFAPLENSLGIIRSRIDRGFSAFIVSSSPHFYEEAIRDWLRARGIHPAGIFLKDYRRVLSVLDPSLTAKDIASQGAYKLGQLIDVLLMTDVPDELVLIGDNFESDPAIYLTVAMLLHGDHEPWHIWNRLKERDSFRLNRRQDADVLSRLHLLGDLIDRSGKEGRTARVKIHIRRRGDERDLDLPGFFRRRIDLVELHGEEG